jgi:hypothetical protein
MQVIAFLNLEASQSIDGRRFRLEFGWCFLRRRKASMKLLLSRLL